MDPAKKRSPMKTPWQCGQSGPGGQSGDSQAAQTAQAATFDGHGDACLARVPLKNPASGNRTPPVAALPIGGSQCNRRITSVSTSGIIDDSLVAYPPAYLEGGNDRAEKYRRRVRSAIGDYYARQRRKGAL
jgi:hypothetical protein